MGEPSRHAPAAPDGDPFEALGDPNRREILRLLGEGDKAVAELAGAMPISRPAVSRHLRLLKQAGLVTEQAEGTRRIYHLHGGARGGPGLPRAGVGGRGRPVPAPGRQHPGRADR